MGDIAVVGINPFDLSGARRLERALRFNGNGQVLLDLLPSQATPTSVEDEAVQAIVDTQIDRLSRANNNPLGAAHEETARRIYTVLAGNVDFALRTAQEYDAANEGGGVYNIGESPRAGVIDRTTDAFITMLKGAGEERFLQALDNNHGVFLDGMQRRVDASYTAVMDMIKHRATFAEPGQSEFWLADLPWYVGGNGHVPSQEGAERLGDRIIERGSGDGNTLAIVNITSLPRVAAHIRAQDVKATPVSLFAYDRL